MNHPSPTKRGIIAVLVLALLGAFALGVAIGGRNSDAAIDDNGSGGVLPVVNQETGQPASVDFSLFWEVWDRLHASYVESDKLNTQELVYGAIRGMVDAAGDSYTTFLPPQESKVFQENVSGEFSGVGIEIGVRDDRLTVIAPLEGTPAKKAGLQSGDVIIAVDGESTDDMTLEGAVQRIRGPRGEPVVLTILRDGDRDTRDISVVRDTIQIPVLEWEFATDEGGDQTNIAHVKLFHFTETAAPLFRDAVNELLNQGAEGVVLDLRGNPGGFLEVAVDISSWFIEPDSVVAIQHFGPSEERSYHSNGHPALQSMPTVVLVDQGSASASEIVAGALRDLRGITVVGTTTFGKGSIQELERFHGGSSLKVTVAKWLTPSGTSIQDGGIEPDITIERPEPEEGQAPEDVPDVQLFRALELLSS